VCRKAYANGPLRGAEGCGHWDWRQASALVAAIKVTPRAATAIVV